VLAELAHGVVVGAAVVVGAEVVVGISKVTSFDGAGIPDQSC